MNYDFDYHRDNSDIISEVKTTAKRLLKRSIHKNHIIDQNEKFYSSIQQLNQ